MKILVRSMLFTAVPLLLVACSGDAPQSTGAEAGVADAGVDVPSKTDGRTDSQESADSDQAGGELPAVETAWRSTANLVGARIAATSAGGLLTVVRVFAESGEQITFDEGAAALPLPIQGSVLARLDPRGQPRWQRAATQGNTSGFALDVGDEETLALFAANSAESYALEGQTVTDRGPWAVRYDASGVPGTPFRLASTSIVAAVGLGDSLILVATLGDRAVELGRPSVTIEPKSTSNLILARLTLSGSVIWSRQLAGSGIVTAKSLQLDAAGKIGLVGQIGGAGPGPAGRPLTLSAGEPEAQTLISTAGDDGFLADTWIARYSVDGELLHAAIILHAADTDAAEIVAWGSDGVQLVIPAHGDRFPVVVPDGAGETREHVAASPLVLVSFNHALDEASVQDLPISGSPLATRVVPGGVRAYSSRVDGASNAYEVQMVDVIAGVVLQPVTALASDATLALSLARRSDGGLIAAARNAWGATRISRAGFADVSADAPFYLLSLP